MDFDVTTDLGSWYIRAHTRNDEIVVGIEWVGGDEPDELPIVQDIMDAVAYLVDTDEQREAIAAALGGAYESWDDGVPGGSWSVYLDDLEVA